MLRRRIALLAAAIMAAAVAAVPLAGAAQADTPDALTQIENHQIPIASDGSSTNFGPTNDIWGRYYTGPNGLEVRFTSDGTVNVLESVLTIGYVSSGTALEGAPSSLGNFLLNAVTGNRLNGAISAAGEAVAAPWTGDAVHSLIQDLIGRNLCLGVTLPDDTLQDIFNTDWNLATWNIAGDVQEFQDPPNGSLWLENCSSAPVSDIVTSVTFPGVSGVVAAQPLSLPSPTPPGVQMFIRGDSSVFARAGVGTSWTQETTPGNATAIAASSAGIQMFIRGDAAVFARGNIGSSNWIEEAVPGNATAIAVGGNTQLFLRNDGVVFATNSLGGAWTQEAAPGTATAIAVSNTGLQMIITSDSQVWAKNGISYGGWTTEVGPGNATKIAVGGNLQMFIRGDSAVFAQNGIGTSWTQETSPGNATQIAVNDAGQQMFIRGDAAVFARAGVGTSWTQDVGPGNAWAIASGSGQMLFARGDNALFANSCIGCSWTQETSPGNTAAIAAG